MTTEEISIVYQGQFGEYTITPEDRRGVLVYRASLLITAVSFASGVGAGLLWGDQPFILNGLTLLYGVFWVALGISLLTIHIYLKPLHQLLQIFWAIGGMASLVIGLNSAEPLAMVVYHHPATLLGMGFTFAALTGIFFKEAFCFDRLETKLLTPLVPILLLGHLAGVLPPAVEKFLLVVWAGAFVLFGLRKFWQSIPSDMGDKSVFNYLEEQEKLKQPAHE